MKKLLLMFAAVGMLFTACNNEPEHIYDDHSADLVGTWSCLTENYAEVLIINADGTAVSYGVEDGEYWENVRGTVVTEGGNITMTFEDNDNLTGHFDIIPKQAFSLYEDSGERYTYHYCENDLADEIIGMWVCMDTPANAESEMMINTFYDNGKSSLTGFLPLEGDSEQVLNEETDYKVIGDLLFIHIPANKFGDKTPFHIVHKMIYTPNATAMGDIMTMKSIAKAEGGSVTGTSSWLRVKQSLNIAGKTYDYCNNYVSDVKGLDKDIEFMGYTMNFANMDGTGLDKMLKSLLFAVEFPDANTINYSYQMNGKKEVYNAPIVVDGNNVIIKMSEKFATLKDVVFLAFQDADDSQMHFFMHKRDFVNFYTNMQAMLMESTDEQFDINNAEAINAIYNEINEAVESINLSLIFKAAK